MTFKPALQNLTPPPISIDANDGTIRPESPDGDAFYGLTVGTNGTAATCRRDLVEGTVTCSMPLRWVRSDGSPAIGVTYVPSDRSDSTFVSPWAG